MRSLSRDPQCRLLPLGAGPGDLSRGAPRFRPRDLAGSAGSFPSAMVVARCAPTARSAPCWSRIPTARSTSPSSRGPRLTAGRSFATRCRIVATSPEASRAPDRSQGFSMRMAKASVAWITTFSPTLRSVRSTSLRTATVLVVPSSNLIVALRFFRSMAVTVAATW